MKLWHLGLHLLSFLPLNSGLVQVSSSFTLYSVISKCMFSFQTLWSFIWTIQPCVRLFPWEGCDTPWTQSYLRPYCTCPHPPSQSALLPVLSTLLPIPSQKPGQMRLQEGRFSWLQASKSSMAPDTASLSSTGQCPPSHHRSLPPDCKPQEGSHHDHDVLLTAVRTRLEPSASAVCGSDLNSILLQD